MSNGSDSSNPSASAAEQESRWATNSSVYDRRLTADYPMAPFEYIPCSIYFYYVRLESDGRIRIDHFFYNDGPVTNPGRWHPITPSEVAPILPGLVVNARSPSPNNPPISGTDFRDVVWTRKGHIVLLIDEENWQLHRWEDGAPAFSFVVPDGTPNHSFFDARDLAVEVPCDSEKSDKRSAVAIVNHMKRNAKGDDLGDEAQTFHFNIYVQVRYSGRDDEKLTIILDPGGTNQGPPEQP